MKKVGEKEQGKPVSNITAYWTKHVYDLLQIASCFGISLWFNFWLVCRKRLLLSGVFLCYSPSYTEEVGGKKKKRKHLNQAKESMRQHKAQKTTQNQSPPFK